MRAGPRPSLSDPRSRLRLLAMLGLVVPVLALAVLAVRYLEARGAAAAEAQRLVWQRVVETEAKALADRADAVAHAVTADLAAAMQAHGPSGLRGAYLARPELVIAVAFDAAGRMVFPEESEIGIHAEEQVLQRAGPDLAAALEGAASGQVGWAGRAAAAGGLAVACLQTGGGTLCPVFAGDALMPGPGGPVLVPAGAPHPARAGMRAATVPLSGPYAGLVAMVDYPVRAARDWAGLALTFGPALISAAAALWLLRRVQRAEIAAERYRRELLAEMSHELRTPLTNIRLFAALIARGAGSGAEGARLRGHAETIESEVRSLGTIVDNALTVAATGTLPGGPLVPADADETVRRAIGRFGPSLGLAAPPGLSLAAGGMAAFDVATFERVLVNLLDNVRRHAPGTVLQIATGREGGRLVLELRDSGPAVSALRPVSPGFGIGLDACRRMAGAAGGRFDGTIAPGGSHFRLELPIGAAGEEAGRCAS